MDLNSEIKPMSHTRSRRRAYWSQLGDRGWGSKKIARLEPSREANKIMMAQICEDASASRRESFREFALTPLDILLEKYKGRPSGGAFF
jgi:hypothetical protein